MTPATEPRWRARPWRASTSWTSASNTWPTWTSGQTFPRPSWAQETWQGEKRLLKALSMALILGRSTSVSPDGTWVLTGGEGDKDTNYFKRATEYYSLETESFERGADLPMDHTNHCQVCNAAIEFHYFQTKVEWSGRISLWQAWQKVCCKGKLFKARFCWNYRVRMCRKVLFSKKVCSLQVSIDEEWVFLGGDNKVPNRAILFNWKTGDFQQLDPIPHAFTGYISICGKIFNRQVKWSIAHLIITWNDVSTNKHRQNVLFK